MNNDFSQLTTLFSFLKKGLFCPDGIHVYIEDEEINKEKIKKEIEQANNSESFSWLAFANKHNFAYYHPEKTEEEIYLSFLYIVKYMIYPEKILTSENSFIFKTWILENLSEIEWVSLDKLLKKYNQSFVKTQHVDEIDFFKIVTRTIHRRRIFQMKHQIGTNDYYFKLPCKKEDFLLNFKRGEGVKNRAIFPIP